MNFKTLTQLPSLMLLGSSLVCSAMAFAHQEGDVFVRAGLGAVMPNESSDDPNDIGELQLNNDVNLAGTVTYMLSDSTGLEVLLGLPFTHEVSNAGKGAVASGVVAEVSHLPLSFAVQHYFAEADSDIRPYVGAGFNYTSFLDEEGKGILAGRTVSVDNSFGYAIQAGVDITVSDDLFVNLSAWYLDIETTVKASGGVQDISATIDPLALMLAVGYTF
ncbi:outer membrane protein OmpW [Marinomonas agarivorans]|nr:outer membrane protein OmpW [Marinomonas agarivorans]